GELNDVGAPLRANVGDSYRLGLEIEANLKLGEQFNWQPNIALSSNKNEDFVFQRDGSLQNLGNTDIAFSPGIVIGSRLAWSPSDALEVALLSKYVGEQYMGNIDSENSILEAYSQTDFNIQYRIDINDFIKTITFSGLVNNIFDAKLVSNGYFFTYDDDFSNPGIITTIEGAGYYPQAGINFLLGATVSF
ncbi:MAG: TonB-dependent receptor, partial [Eudoraea sp.]|nr:TonB-dependent receptor [Eudoraea sp.]NNJ41068.1 TonB-dependent receptor [Eudoraea sp.]